MGQKAENFPVRGGVNVLPLPLPLGRRGPHTRTWERPPGVKGGHWLRENKALRPTTANNNELGSGLFPQPPNRSPAEQHLDVGPVRPEAENRVLTFRTYRKDTGLALSCSL